MMGVERRSPIVRFYLSATALGAAAVLFATAAHAEQPIPDSVAALKQEVLRLRAENARLKAAPPKATPALVDRLKRTAEGRKESEAAFREYNREHGYSEEKKVATAPAPSEDSCNPNHLFIRADSIDNYIYGITPASKAKGASISYTNDRFNKSKALGIDGMVSYALGTLCGESTKRDRPFVSGAILAPFVEAHGTFTRPRAASEKSSLKFGAEAQLEISDIADAIPARQVFTFAPYYQTDFRGEANIWGANGYIDLYDLGYHLGGYIPDEGSPLGLFWQLRGEVDARRVENPGVTKLDDRNYVWLGGTARLSLFFFPSQENSTSWIVNRFSIVLSANYFTDVKSSIDVHKFMAALKYKLDEAGMSSIGLEYSRGTDKETLARSNQYIVKLLYAY